MEQSVYLGMRDGDLDGKPYAKYWQPRMQAPQRQVREAILHGPEASEFGFVMEQADTLLQPGYLALETGVTTLANGTSEMRGDDPDLGDREKYLTTHYVTEYVGTRLQRIRISFIEPAEFFSGIDTMGVDKLAE